VGKIMLDEDFVTELKEFDYYKQLIIKDQAKGRNVIIQKKDKTYGVVPQMWLGDSRYIDWEDIERVTVFIKTKAKKSPFKITWKEYEFVVTQGLDD
jgi:hypothetical protein